MNIESIVLAAGKGTRMKSAEIPKVMHLIAAYPMLGWIIETLSSVSYTVNVVAGYKKEKIIEFCRTIKNADINISIQEKQNGTGGAVREALASVNKKSDYFLITAGDVPLIKEETLKKFIDIASGEKLALISTELDDPGHFGRVVRKKSGSVSRIVEYSDADKEQKKIKEINSGIYLAERNFLEHAILMIENKNAKNEYYLTDIVEIAEKSNIPVFAYMEKDSISLAGVNNRYQLAMADSYMQKRIKRKLMESGVTMRLPDTIYIEKNAQIHPGAELNPGCLIKSSAIVKSDAVIEANSVVD